MAAIAHRSWLPLALCSVAFPALCSDTVPQQLYRQVAIIATSLTAGNPGEAMTPFDKSFPAHDRLQDYFIALTNAYQVNSNLEVTDETISDAEATLTVNWVLTLNNLQSGSGETRAEDVTVRLAMKKGKWRIVDLSPLELFNPAPKH